MHKTKIEIFSQHSHIDHNKTNHFRSKPIQLEEEEEEQFEQLLFNRLFSLFLILSIFIFLDIDNYYLYHIQCLPLSIP